MKIFWQSLQTTGLFLKNSRHYLRDLIVIHALMLLVLLPALRFLLRFVLQNGEIPYLSFDNLGTIVTQHGVVFACLILLVILLLFVVYFEFTFLIFSIYFILNEKVPSVIQILGLSWQKVRRTTPLKLIFFFGYFLVLLPLSGLGFHSELLAKIQIPSFILDFIFQQRYLVVTGFIIVYLISLYLALRLVYVIVFFVLENISVGAAIKKSWQQTRRRFLPLLTKILTLYLAILAVVGFIFLLTVSFQQVVENLWPQHAAIVAAFLLTELHGLSLLQSVLLSALLFFIVENQLQQDGLLPKHFATTKKVTPNSTHVRWQNIGLVLILFGLAANNIVSNIQTLKNLTFSPPLVIAHRGVDHSNGLQNSLDALEKTAASQPDFVEMDIFQTIDGKFVVVHDRNLKNLTGKNLVIDQMTLEQATSLTATENGQSALLVSFDDYLKKAEELDQKLIVEIKTTPNDSPELVADFLALYEKQLSADGSWVQSLTFNTVEEVERLAPELTTGYTLPFNIAGVPETSADFLAVEHTTLNQSFVKQATDAGKKVISWDINDATTMERVVYYGANGVITDETTLLKNSLETIPEKQSYADKLLYFWIGIG
ncbi:glycerophosphoryl diester phosphodiesterase membrane domain-containing protein [Enterococcus timonensis]|uniref:glycerophosphoryl diester phosphodiesterase membrane domain-containing protein n=1 Tax=Enterococcus timonensis TaxID=1852364 RepID=UPI0008DAC41F|nr:glycerophosphodiester phosphodiesterase [Enterococcus timonensis]